MAYYVLEQLQLQPNNNPQPLWICTEMCHFVLTKPVSTV